MPRKSKEKQKHRKWDERSTQRTAEFIVARLAAIQDDIADLIAEFRALEKFDDVITAACAVRDLEGLRKAYKKMSEGQTWEDDE